MAEACGPRSRLREGGPSRGRGSRLWVPFSRLAGDSRRRMRAVGWRVRRAALAIHRFPHPIPIPQASKREKGTQRCPVFAENGNSDSAECFPHPAFSHLLPRAGEGDNQISLSIPLPLAGGGTKPGSRQQALGSLLPLGGRRCRRRMRAVGWRVRRAALAIHRFPHPIPIPQASKQASGRREPRGVRCLRRTEILTVPSVSLIRPSATFSRSREKGTIRCIRTVRPAQFDVHAASPASSGPSGQSPASGRRGRGRT